MERFRGGLWFWALLIVSMIPAVAHGQTLKKSQKCLYTASIAPDGGSSQLVRTSKLYLWPDGSTTSTVDFSYAVRSFKLGIEKVEITNGNWSLPLCDNTTADSCDYDATNTLYLSGVLPSPLPQGFNTALENGLVVINLLDGNGVTLASGTYTLAQACSFRTY